MVVTLGVVALAFQLALTDRSFIDDKPEYANADEDCQDIRAATPHPHCKTWPDNCCRHHHNEHPHTEDLALNQVFDTGRFLTSTCGKL